MQEIFQYLAVVGIGGRDRRRVDHAALAVHADMPLHPEMPLVAFLALVHFSIAFLLLVPRHEIFRT